VALGGDGVVEVSDGETGDDQGCVLETSVTGLDVNELHPIATVTSNESDNSDSASDGRSSGATSVRSIGNLNNFSIIDTTLREGEQFATAYFDTATKIKIARALDDIGVEYVSLWMM
jgi:homocitrate synthase